MSVRLVHRCYDCGRDQEVETRYQHAARLLCDECSSKRGPGRAPDGSIVPRAQNRKWREAELDALFPDSAGDPGAAFERELKDAVRERLEDPS